MRTPTEKNFASEKEKSCNFVMIGLSYTCNNIATFFAKKGPAREILPKNREGKFLLICLAKTMRKKGMFSVAKKLQ